MAHCSTYIKMIMKLEAFYVYPTSSASDDYSCSRHFSDRSKKNCGFTIEFGKGN